MVRFLKLLGWGFVGTAALYLLSATCYAVWRPSADKVALGQILSQVSAVLVPASLLLAFGGLFLNKSREVEDVEEKRSHFYLDSCVAAYQDAQRLLADNNNDRMTWIAAGRTLKHAQELAKEVTFRPYQRVLDLQRLQNSGF